MAVLPFFTSTVLYLGVGYRFMAAPAKAQPLLPTLDEGYLLTATTLTFHVG